MSLRRVWKALKVGFLCIAVLLLLFVGAGLAFRAHRQHVIARAVALQTHNGKTLPALALPPEGKSDKALALIRNKRLIRSKSSTETKGAVRSELRSLYQTRMP